MIINVSSYNKYPIIACTTFQMNLSSGRIKLAPYGLAWESSLIF
jgi:hypothetical protein